MKKYHLSLYYYFSPLFVADIAAKQYVLELNI